MKTRLAAELGVERACALYAAFTADLVERFRSFPARRLLCFAPAEAAAHFAAIGRGEYEMWSQPAGDLGERLRAFFEQHVRRGERGIAIGSDSPTLPREHVARAFEMLERHDCVLCPATDGGYCLIGLRDGGLPIFGGIEWSSPHVLEQTIARVKGCGASLALLPPWYDVDTAADLAFLRGHVRAMLYAGQTVDLPHTLPQLEES